MIRLNRPAKPNVLESKADRWTEELRSYLDRGEKPPEHVQNRYRHDEVKASLRTASFEKCAYCESKPTHVSPGDIEHIKPKSLFPYETFTWENLGFSCSICNQSKGNSYDPTCPPVNPYSDEPSAFLICSGSMVWGKPGVSRGRLTVELLKLNRPELLERRTEKLEQLVELLDSKERAEPALQQFFDRKINEFTNEDKEYSLVLRNALAELMRQNDNSSF